MNYPVPTERITYTAATIIGAALLLVPPVALGVLLASASWQARVLSRGLGGQWHPAGFTLVPGRAVACTVGLWRPRVLISADVWGSGHGAVVLRHEQAHVRGRHALLIILARASLVLWWWIPGSRRLLDDLCGALEESADASAARQHGRLRVARALVEAVTGTMPAAALGFGNGIEQRVVALRRRPGQTWTWVAVGVSAVIVPLWLVLF